jgi:hypothetical protein
MISIEGEGVPHNFLLTEFHFLEVASISAILRFLRLDFISSIDKSSEFDYLNAFHVISQ